MRLPAILDIPLRKRHAVAYNFIPMSRDLNRSDDRLIGDAILNWQALLHESIASNEGSRP